MVEYVDGSVLAQLGNPDMRTPIAHALAYPERIAAGVNFLDLMSTGTLRFEKPDLSRFPCLALAFDALRAGNGAATVVNAANEVAVARFLEGDLGFMDIPRLIESVLTTTQSSAAHSLADVLALDHAAREQALLWNATTSMRNAVGAVRS
jgi:1-deoxy-D-xylulose-5-phosphate reductoisomerase